MLHDFGTFQAAQKPDGSLVTQSDQWADLAIREAIAKRFPSHGVLSEEGEHVFPGDEWCWVIDPLDGTTNFTRGLPLWGISMGLLYQGTPVFGYVYLPSIQQAFYGYWHDSVAMPGPTGAFLNHHPIHVSADAPTGNHFFNLCARSTAVMKQPFPCKIRMLGVATYNVLTVAAGIAVGGVEATPKIWDIAAVWAIAQAAGATWTALEAEPIFPLKVGTSYGDRAFPTLVTSREEWVPQFKPLVDFLGR